MSETRQQRILIVEDHDASAEDYQIWLQEEGYLMARAAAHADALTVARDFHPDVVVLDIKIPSLPGAADESIENGVRTLVTLLDEEPFRPVVVLTAYDHPELIRDVMRRNRGGFFLFKQENVRRSLSKAVAVALASPAYQTNVRVRRFTELVASRPPEEALRNFLRQNWYAILGPEYQQCLSNYAVSRGVKVDLLLVRHDNFADIWELKRPDQKVLDFYNDRIVLSQDCARALGQVMEYIDLAEREPQGHGSYEARKGMSVSLSRTRGFVVIGRYQDARERDALKRVNRFLAGITILTYDDLQERAGQLLLFLREHRNGESG